MFRYSSPGNVPLCGRQGGAATAAGAGAGAGGGGDPLPVGGEVQVGGICENFCF